MVYDQEAMRPHLNTSFETNKIVPFPVLKHLRPANKVAKIEECILHCCCRMPDDGYEMVCCDLCDAWYHKACVEDPYCKDGSWLCTHCMHHKCTPTSCSSELSELNIYSVVSHCSFLTCKREIFIVHNIEHVGVAGSYLSPTRSAKAFEEVLW